MGVDLNGLARDFGLEPYLIDRLYRRLSLGRGSANDATSRVKLLCVAAATRRLIHPDPARPDISEWIRFERTPIDDAIDEANKPHPRWSRFDWDVDDEAAHGWQPAPGVKVRVFTHAREFIGYAVCVTFVRELYDPDRRGYVDESEIDSARRLSLREKTGGNITRTEYRFAEIPPGWARRYVPTQRLDVGRIAPA